MWRRTESTWAWHHLWSSPLLHRYVLFSILIGLQVLTNVTSGITIISKDDEPKRLQETLTMSPGPYVSLFLMYFFLLTKLNYLSDKGGGTKTRINDRKTLTAQPTTMTIETRQRGARDPFRAIGMFLFQFFLTIFNIFRYHDSIRSVKETYGRGCRMHRRRTGRADRSYEIRWRERGTERSGKAERITQGWKTWPQLMCCALASRNVGSFDLRTGQGLRSNEGIGSRIVMLARRRIRTEYLGQVEGQVTGGLVWLQASD